MHDDFYQVYLEELEMVPQCTAEEEAMLIRQILNGTEAGRSRLIEGNLKKVLSYAKDYADRGLPMNDLVQEANMALTALAMEYEEGDFQELLKQKVCNALEAAVEEQKREAEIEETVAARVNVLQKVSQVLAEELGREATVEELAEKMKMTADEVKDIMKTALDAVNVGNAMNMDLGPEDFEAEE